MYVILKWAILNDDYSYLGYPTFKYYMRMQCGKKYPKSTQKWRYC